MDGKKNFSISQLNPVSMVFKKKQSKTKNRGISLKLAMGRGHQTVLVGPSRGQQTVVDHGGNIPGAQSFYDKLKSVDTSVELFFVPEWEIESKPEVIVN